ncbi:polysaccharide lyase family 7 protein [Granulosicoccus sp.]|nr:polysaccharide lyase family 7 protein [Granulosicoccus sp.]
MKLTTARTLAASTLLLSAGLNTAFAQTFSPQAAGDFGNSHPRYPASNAIDGNTEFGSRWAATFEGGSANLFVDLGQVRRIDDIGIAFGRGNRRSYNFEIRARSRTSGEWTRVFRGESGGRTEDIEQFNVDDVDARQVRVKVFSNSEGTDYADITEFEVYGTSGPSGGNRPTVNPPSPPINPPRPINTPVGGGNFGLNPNAEPWDNFDLSRWALDSPAPRSNDRCKSERTWDYEWSERNPLSRASRPFLFTHSDGGMRFVTRVDGATTNSSCNEGFPRSELREMLRRGNEDIEDTGVTRNNWKLGYQPGNRRDWGGENGVMNATLRVNRVTTTGDSGQVGRVIIGQIHARDDEPLKLYYRKRSGESKGCIYFAHEIRTDDDITFELIGDRNCTSGPSNGIELNELFSYTISNDDEDLSVVIRRGDRNGRVIAQQTIDMDSLNSGYDRSDESMYFKAGAYTQNDSGRGSDGDIVTFYRLSVSHD